MCERIRQIMCSERIRPVVCTVFVSCNVELRFISRRPESPGAVAGGHGRHRGGAGGDGLQGNARVDSRVVTGDIRQHPGGVSADNVSNIPVHEYLKCVIINVFIGDYIN